jgi:purine-binding chemotaxis protein CheW
MTSADQYCTFLLEGSLFGVSVAEVQEVIRYQQMTPVPLAPAVIGGMINLRGQIVTAIDLRQRMELHARAEGTQPMNVVVCTQDGAVSLLVDDIGEVIEVSESSFERPPETLRGAVREMVRGVHKLPDRLLLVLDIERTVNAGKTAVTAT